MKHALALLALILVLNGCALWQKVDTPLAEAPDKSYTVELPLGWVRWMQEPDGIAITRDGFDLNRIAVRRRALDKAFPTLKKAASDSMLPSDLAELQIAELKSQAKDMPITVKDNSPAQIGGQPGFRIHLQYKNDRGLPFDLVIYGLVTAKGYFTLGFNAPAVYYSGRFLGDFEKLVASFRLTG
jgi:hypothetical protein